MLEDLDTVNMAEKTETEQEKHREPFRDTEDISLILYKRAIQQEALLKETRLREKNIREEVGKAKMRYEVAALKISKILPKKAALDDTLGRKEAKLREILERINMVKRFRENCILYMERGNIAEKKVKETQDQIATVIGLIFSFRSLSFQSLSFNHHVRASLR